MAEATAVAPEGRISPADLGLWSEAHAEALAPVARFIRDRGAVPGIQLAHAGRKASTDIPWRSQRALSAVEGGWELERSVALAGWLKEVGIDLIDCSSGGLVPDAKVPAGPGYLTPFSATLRERAGIATAAVGMITDPTQAEQIVATGLADAVSLAWELLRHPYWPLHAAQALGVDLPWPAQYARAK